MKVFIPVLLGLLFNLPVEALDIGLITTAASNDCPRHNNGVLITFPHETDCDKFYACIEGVKELRKCPLGLHYDEIQGLCDWPSVANCQLTSIQPAETSTQSSTTVSSSSTSSKAPSTSRGTTTTPRQTTTTPRQTSTTPRQTTTTPRQTTTTPRQTSTTPRETTTTPRQTSTTPRETTTTPRQTSTTPRQTSTTPRETTTTPRQTTTTPRETPTSTVKPTSTSSLPSSVSTPATESSSRPPANSTTPASSTTNKPTTIGKPTTQQPTSSSQLPPSSTSVRPSTSIGKPSSTPSTSSPVTSTSEESSSNEESTTDLPSPSTTESDSNEESTTDLPSSSIPEEESSEEESVPNESSETTETSPPSISNECPPISSENGEVIHLPHETNCSLFYKCDNGEKVVFNCPDGLYFNPELEVCDWPYNVNCTNKLPAVLANFHLVKNKVYKREIREINSNEETTTESWENPDSCIGDCPIIDPEEYTVIIPNIRCDKFCLCSNGSPIVKSCPGDLYYNPELQVCDWPSNVNCTNELSS